MAQQGGLGRGLSSLIPQKKQKQRENGKEINFFGSSEAEYGNKKQSVEKSVRASDVEINQGKGQVGSSKVGEDIVLRSIMEVPIEVISPNPHQPRRDFNEEGLQELANSIKEHGVLQPVVVSRIGADHYELIAGERRLEASKIIGLEKIPVIVKKVDEQSKAELALVENIQRLNLNPIEESMAYKKLHDSFALTQEEIALKAGKSRSAISNALRLLSLPNEIQKALVEGSITEGHARSILAVSNSEKQRALFELILKERLTVRQTENKVRDVTEGSRKSRKRYVDPDLQANEEKLAQKFGTKVRIKKSKTGGQIIIDFYSEEEFDTLLTGLL